MLRHFGNLFPFLLPVFVDYLQSELIGLEGHPLNRLCNYDIALFVEDRFLADIGTSADGAVMRLDSWGCHGVGGGEEVECSSGSGDTDE